MGRGPVKTILSRILSGVVVSTELEGEVALVICRDVHFDLNILPRLKLSSDDSIGKSSSRCLNK